MSQLRKYFKSNKTRVKQAERIFNGLELDGTTQLYRHYCDKIYSESAQMYAELYSKKRVEYEYFQTDLFIEQGKTFIRLKLSSYLNLSRYLCENKRCFMWAGWC